MTKRRIKLTDVAEHANVSRATASLVLRGSPKVSDETRRRVEQSMEELGYVYNRGAASLRTNESHTIALLVNDILNPFFLELTVGIEEILDESQYALLLSHTAEKVDKQKRFLDKSREYGADGILICPTSGTQPTIIQQLQASKTPFVMIARYVPGFKEKVNYVGANNADGSYKATRYLLDQGHRRIAFIGGPEASSARFERLQGYQRALAEANIEFDASISIQTPTARRAGQQAIVDLLDRTPEPTAAVCYNDIVALGVLMGLKTSGLVPGQDFSVVGFDDILEAQYSDPPLTTVSVSPKAVGYHAVTLLLECIRNPDQPPQQQVLDTELIIRQS